MNMVELLNSYLVGLIKRTVLKMSSTKLQNTAVIFKLTSTLLPYVKKYNVYQSRSKFQSRVFTSGMTQLDLNACYTLHLH